VAALAISDTDKLTLRRILDEWPVDLVQYDRLANYRTRKLTDRIPVAPFVVPILSFIDKNGLDRFPVGQIQSVAYDSDVLRQALYITDGTNVIPIEQFYNANKSMEENHSRDGAILVSYITPPGQWSSFRFHMTQAVPAVLPSDYAGNAMGAAGATQYWQINGFYLSGLVGAGVAVTLTTTVGGHVLAYGAINALVPNMNIFNFYRKSADANDTLTATAVGLGVGEACDLYLMARKVG
jgi:hypothetical protein